MKSLTKYITESNEGLSKGEFVELFIKKWGKSFEQFNEITSAAKNVSTSILSRLNFYEYEGNNIKEIAADDYDQCIESDFELGPMSFDPEFEPDSVASAIWVDIRVKKGADKEMEQEFFDCGTEIFGLDPNKTYDGQILRDESGYMFMLSYPEDLIDTAQKIVAIDKRL